ncbi:MAG: hypothetical protein K0S18_173 [Anaerocolumna sp.]|jgi:flagellar protein FlgJ|nr:hypothetical protein [Anaerocolumna sp.]
MNISAGTNSILNSTLSTINNTGKLENKLKENNGQGTDEELMEACKSFETYFVEQVFNEMKKTIPNQEEQNEYVNYFGDMLYEKYAENITDSGNLGIAQMLYESMKRN